VRTDLFDFELPEERIALHPARPRDAARLLVVRPGLRPGLEDRIVRDLPGLLQPGDALVLNDTRVIHAELRGTRYRDEAIARVSATLVKRLGDSEWLALARPAKRLQAGDRILFGESVEACALASLDATVVRRGDGGEVYLAFDKSGPALDEAIAAVGEVPLPPYIAGRRSRDPSDESDYQTVFARHEGAVAAPTAGLHLTDGLLVRLAERDVSLHYVTLHVGAATFLPVTTEDTAGHRMHPEWGEISSQTAAALRKVRKSGGRIVALGTTSTRLLESAAAMGEIEPFSGETSIFITPGYRFRMVDVLLTNFHLPRSTLFMLVSAFSGLACMKRAYAHAIDNGYRFYSFGDACLLYPRSAEE
jgi:S-adenosylmethionine:tRNA ribosyltransferase-isomerase